MAENVEQPVASSVTDETVVNEVPASEPAVEAAPAPEKAPQVPEISEPNRNKRSAANRIAELVARSKEADARAEAAERRAREAEYAARANQGYAQAQPGDEDPLVSELRAQRAMIAKLAEDTAYARDARQREEFWSANDHVSDDVIEAVEGRLAEFRSNGLDKVKREDLLYYELGKRRYPEIQAATKKAAATPAVNRVAIVEGGSTAPRSAVKSPEDMTLAELREFMKDKTF